MDSPGFGSTWTTSRIGGGSDSECSSGSGSGSKGRLGYVPLQEIAVVVVFAGTGTGSGTETDYCDGTHPGFARRRGGERGERGNLGEKLAVVRRRCGVLFS